MADSDDIAARAPGWNVTEKPPRLDRRFTFDSYDQTRRFLDLLAELSEQENYYPDLSFGRMHVHVTIYARNAESLSDQDIEFARRTTELGESDQ